MANWQKQKRIDLNPSSADRWMTCTASPKYIYDNWDRLPPENHMFSDPGNTAHEVAAALLQTREIIPGNCPTKVDGDMHWHAFNYAEFVLGLMQPESNLLVEKKLPLFYAQGRNAVIDAAIIDPDFLHIVDFKYGEGVIVSPEYNLQASIYAKTATYNGERWVEPPKDFPVSITIFQPRTRGDAPYHTWETTWQEIKEITENIIVSAIAIQNSRNLVFLPSEKACQFCPAKGFCDARQKTLTKDVEALAVIDNGPRTLPKADTLPDSQLAAILTHKAQIISWLNDAEEYALTSMKAGKAIPGFKLVTSRGGNRYWTNPEKAGKLLQASTILREEEIYKKTVIGPGAAEKLLGKHKLNVELTNLISRPPGQPVIAKADDEREDCFIDAAKEFDNLDKFALDQF